MALIPHVLIALLLFLPLKPTSSQTWKDVDNSCPLSTDPNTRGTFGEPCTAGRYCVRESTVSFEDNVCCPCPKGGFYCPGHKKR